MFEIVNVLLKSVLWMKKLHIIMQGMAIKIDIKLNIDDLNWSLDGQIIDNMKQENGHFYQFSHQN